MKENNTETQKQREERSSRKGAEAKRRGRNSRGGTEARRTIPRHPRILVACVALHLLGLIPGAILWINYLHFDNWVARWVFRSRFDNWIELWGFWERLPGVLLSTSIFLFVGLCVWGTIFCRRRRWFLAFAIASCAFQCVTAWFFIPSAVLCAILFLPFLAYGVWIRSGPLYYVMAAGIFFAFLFGGVPSLHDEKIRSKASQTLWDIRALGLALENYMSERGVYPAWTLDPEKKAKFRTTRTRLPSFARCEGVAGPWTYLPDVREYPRDVFSYDNEHRTFAYYAPDNVGWILLSAGPNCVFDVDFETLKKVYDPARSNPTPELLLLTYDPTNGTVSAGDIWMVKQ